MVTVFALLCEHSSFSVIIAFIILVQPQYQAVFYVLSNPASEPLRNHKIPCCDLGKGDVLIHAKQHIGCTEYQLSKDIHLV